MGQVSSVERGFKSPISISDELKLSQINITNKNNQLLKKILIDSSNELNLPSSPISTFTQNSNITEFQFLIDLNQNDIINFNLHLKNEVLEKFKDKTIYKDVKLSFLDLNKNIISKYLLFKEINLNEVKKEGEKQLNILYNENIFNIQVPLSLLPKFGQFYLIIYTSDQTLIQCPFSIKKLVEPNVSLKPPPSSILYKESTVDEKFKFLNDGPDFRNNIIEIEQKLINLRPTIKAIVKKSQELDESLRNVTIIRSSLSNLFNELLQFNSLNSTELINDLMSLLSIQSTEDLNQSNLITKNIITPLSMIYESDLKLINQNKKTFNENSNEFYNWQNKFLVNNVKSNSTAFEKRKEFEVNRLMYFNSLIEFKYGYFIRNFLNCLADFLQECKSSANLNSNELNKNIAKAKFLYENYNNFNNSQLEKVNELKNIKNFQQLESFFQIESNQPSLQSHSRSHSHSHSRSHSYSKSGNATIGTAHITSISTPLTPPVPALPTQLTSASPVKINKAVTSNSPPSTSSKVLKKGILNTLITKNWQKQYIILENNILSEFTDWKEGKILRCDPINLTFSCIKKVSIKDRNYCFEVLTPTGTKRVFQADNDIERDSWLKALNAAIAIQTQPKSSKHLKDNSVKSPRSFSNNTNELNCLVNSSSQSPHHNNEQRKEQVELSALEIVQDADESNRYCCDCGSSNSIDWISINLLIVMCIDCSGAHRSLGTHISKIRSLTLDNKSFETPESKELLKNVSNRYSNSYWETNLNPNEKISKSSNQQERQIFITNKYLNKLYLQRENINSNELLVEGIHFADVKKILKALAFNANINLYVIKNFPNNEKLDISLFEYSLYHSHKDENNEDIYDVSQLLLLNNASCGGKINHKLNLNDSQLKYWNDQLLVYGLKERKHEKSSDENKVISFRKNSQSSKSKEKSKSNKSNRSSFLRLAKLK